MFERKLKEARRELREAERLVAREYGERARVERENLGLRCEVRILEEREKLNLKERDEARGNVGRNDLLVVGNAPSEVRVYLNGAYVPQARAVEAAQHPDELRNVTLHLSAICRFVDTMDEAS